MEKTSSSSVYFDYLEVAVTIHHTNTVSVAISCSFKPIAVDIPDILPLCEALTRTEINLANIIKKLLRPDPQIVYRNSAVNILDTKIILGVFE
ncbi:MAG: hypothetical protein WA364_25660 [Candidatus Nitrosopolaris sp.]